ncbi:PIN domain-containing protein [Demequina sp. TTPB684]|uniref:PIN domain-containing protein n=1 Tax=unclassified Demequina TaxID=2620311 RepID=UPI001CF5B96F|nr:MULTISPECIES: PIN domain-containing protein [unclassified Demequina]MCB2413685.1 PIN domain-containing protein [Demequina sp. TTPB684]UPU87747.1 PIN domain-containing protein [Demequina sp. TMPB413]
MIYVDGSALMRFLPGVRYFDEWNGWAVPRLGELATTQLGLTELRQAAELFPRETKARAFEIVERVKARVPVIRFSDENVNVSTHAASVLKPFAALHLGAAVTHPAIDTIATYDAELARVAELYALGVVTPGMPDGWHNGSSSPIADTKES